MNKPTPLPTTSGVNKQEIGGGSLAEIPPDRYPDHAATDTARYLIVRWQDDRAGKWSKEKLISLGTTGQERMDRSLQPMGMYRSRQFEFIFSEPCLFVLCAAEDDIGGLE